MKSLHALWRAGLLLLCGLQTAAAAEVSLLSAGAIEPGLRPALAAFEKASGHVGVAVRPGAALPDISSLDAVKRAMLEADSVVYNLASTGLYFETQVKKICGMPA